MVVRPRLRHDGGLVRVGYLVSDAVGHHGLTPLAIVLLGQRLPVVIGPEHVGDLVGEGVLLEGGHAGEARSALGLVATPGAATTIAMDED